MSRPKTGTGAARAILARMAAGGGKAIGECLQEAKREIGARRPAVLRTFNLLGDPAME